ncbi:MAG: VWA domain-containing protein [Treponema sp.]|nr:VWA domain-containing protein [Treponema sp.]
MKKLLFLLFALFILFWPAACSNDNAGLLDGKEYPDSEGGGYYDPSAAAPGTWETGGGDAWAGEDGGGENGNRNRPSPGQLTCGEWSDIKNFEFYINLFNSDDDPEIEESQRRSGFSQFIGYFGFETRYMFAVNVQSGGAPAADAVVELSDSSHALLFAAKTDIRGNAYLFPAYDLSGENITVKAKSGSYQKEETFAYTGEDLQITLDGQAAKQSVLDIMFVIDTTGSMSDELNYLKTEISDVIGKIADGNRNYAINLALLFYRDAGDEYVTRYFDFTTNIPQQQQNLKRQSANGGGDFPEAVDKALSEAVGKNWSGGYATRLIFHVCDAPPHDGQEYQTLYYNSIRTAAGKGIRIIPVASSGIDSATEFLLRQEALMTGGTYIFLTDDSGIGNSHLQPTVGEYTVEYLNACIIRIVNEYLTGAETPPEPYY